MNLRHMIEALCRRVLREKDKLTELDQAVGDGDIGANLERGANSILALLAKVDPNASTRILLVEVAKALNAAGCGTGGTLISIGILAGAARSDSLQDFCEAALAKIQASGKAQPGEKTMVDALLPAVQALRDGRSIEKAAAAARKGSEKTAEMVGTKGRSLYSQTRAQGVADPGAYLVAALFDEAAHLPKESNDEKDH